MLPDITTTREQSKMFHKMQCCHNDVIMPTINRHYDAIIAALRLNKNLAAVFFLCKNKLYSPSSSWAHTEQRERVSLSRPPYWMGRWSEDHVVRHVGHSPAAQRSAQNKKYPRTEALYRSNRVQNVIAISNDPLSRSSTVVCSNWLSNGVSS